METLGQRIEAIRRTHKADSKQEAGEHSEEKTF